MWWYNLLKKFRNKIGKNPKNCLPPDVRTVNFCKRKFAKNSLHRPDIYPDTKPDIVRGSFKCPGWFGQDLAECILKIGLHCCGEAITHHSRTINPALAGWRTWCEIIDWRISFNSLAVLLKCPVQVSIQQKTLFSIFNKITVYGKVNIACSSPGKRYTEIPDGVGHRNT